MQVFITLFTASIQSIDFKQVTFECKKLLCLYLLHKYIFSAKILTEKWKGLSAGATYLR